MKPEGEVTRISLDNIEELLVQHGSVKFIEHFSVYDDEERTMIYFDDGHVHQATGFAVGYPGEAPEGLLEIIWSRLGRTDITRKHVQREWKRGDGKVRLILRNQGVGDSISIHPGVMDCAYDLEVW